MLLLRPRRHGLVVCRRRPLCRRLAVLGQRLQLLQLGELRVGGGSR